MLCLSPFAEKAGASGWGYKAGRELWDRAPALSYAPPTVGWALRRQAVSLGALAGWLLAGAAAAWTAVARMRVT